MAEPAQVRVVVPAQTDFLQLLRLNVAGVLGDAGFTIEEIDDVKIAVEELAAILLRAGDGDELDVTIALEPDGATITGRRAAGSSQDVELEDFVATILDAVVDSSAVDHDGSTATFTLRKRLRGR